MRKYLTYMLLMLFFVEPLAAGDKKVNWKKFWQAGVAALVAGNVMDAASSWRQPELAFGNPLFLIAFFAKINFVNS